MFYCKGVKPLDIRQLEYFVELAKTRNFRKASVPAGIEQEYSPSGSGIEYSLD